mmetsp:Transcript_29825/g.68441  ORF Transcript_29825/g.68441 Transcript_29825/m.68441 type:complete len:90 (-) Transcript_29825:32-301(-)
MPSRFFRNVSNLFSRKISNGGLPSRDVASYGEAWCESANKKKCGRDDEVGAGRDGYSKSAVVELVRIREEDKCCWVGITRELDILKVRN